MIGYLTVGVSVPTPGAAGGFHYFYKLAMTQFFGASDSDAGAAEQRAQCRPIGPRVRPGVEPRATQRDQRRLGRADPHDRRAVHRQINLFGVLVPGLKH